MGTGMAWRVSWGACGLLAALSTLPMAGCDGAASNRQPLTTGGSAPSTVVRSTSDAGDGAEAGGAGQAVTIGAGAPDPATYTTMCNHYCETLQQTDTYDCLVQGDTVDSCQAKFAELTAECESLRCPTGRVDVALCLSQCASLDADYTMYCATKVPAPDSACPATPQDHDEACRAGCVVAPPA